MLTDFHRDLWFGVEEGTRFMSDIFLGFENVRSAMNAPSDGERSAMIKKLKEELWQLFDQEERSGGVSFSVDDPYRADVRPNGIINDFTAQFEALLKVGSVRA